ncbi:MAG: flavodoxin-dependent (E)-4-hydroxy-3-methylbut-2-enyl-diphosphate synthase [Eubacteriales bacterium]|nr:flavodoxin-dependent (E)-4-hydroxy-3-methylbut-2-enyl-diphosphate synthase [Eubacteriales bacterium]MDD4474585.1 flavodoxin-dependent (E)-4-hydroxy-3-methylbut-2-enyl-diphosphate synthase [Eubacteriales bacterium]
MNIKRRMTRIIDSGRIRIGHNFPISVQSMTNTDTADRAATLAQIKRLEEAGCDIVRFTVNNMKAAENIPFYKENTMIPLVADIHFDYKLALAAADLGIDKIRINPGNIGDSDRIKKVAESLVKNNIPVRIGVNSGSVEKKILEKYGSATAEALAESAIYNASLFEEYGVRDIVVSIKSSNVAEMIKANRIVASKTDYPLHIGVTEAGTPRMGIIKSAIGIGSLLADGIGDTIRVSLTAKPEEEIPAAKDILSALRLTKRPNIISCPTCGRTGIDLIGIATKLEEELDKLNINENIDIAVMGCAVNGPGEARHADIGVAGGNGEAIIFRKGEIVRKIPESEVIDTLLAEIKSMISKE